MNNLAPMKNCPGGARYAKLASDYDWHPYKQNWTELIDNN